MKTLFLFTTLALTSLFLLPSCTTVAENGRRQFNIIGDSQASKMGFGEFEKMKRSKKISHNPSYRAQINRVAKRLTPVIPIRNAKWEFVLFEDPSPNAFALPGGKVGIHTGIFKITKNDAGLATVIGHELAHVTARHSAERVSHQLLTTGLLVGVDALLKNKGASSKTRATSAALGGAAATVGHILPFSRKQELEADRNGVIYIARAGYDPYESIALWKRFAAYKKKSGKKVPAFLSTHPVDETRIRNLEAFMPTALAQAKKR